MPSSMVQRISGHRALTRSRNQNKSEMQYLLVCDASALTWSRNQNRSKMQYLLGCDALISGFKN